MIDRAGRSREQTELIEYGGYEKGQVRIHSGGQAGTVPYVNGTTTNPVPTIADAIALCTALNLDSIYVSEGLIITIPTTFLKRRVSGLEHQILLNGQNVTNSTFLDAYNVSGIYTGAPTFENCRIDDIIGDGGRFRNCEIDTMVANTTGVWRLSDCYAGAASWEYADIFFGTGVGATHIIATNFTGGIEISQMTTGDSFAFYGTGSLVIGASCTGGTIFIAGSINTVEAEILAFIAAGGSVEEQSNNQLRNQAGYEGGFIYYDNANGVPGSVNFVNGTITRPCSAFADVLTLGAALEMKRVHVPPGASIALPSALTDWMMDGENWDVALNGKDVSGTHFQHATINGITPGTLMVQEGAIHDVTAQGCDVHESALSGTLINGAAATTWIFHTSYSAVAGTGSPVFNANSLTCNINVRDHSGGMEIQNFVAGSNMTMEGMGQLIINANCTGGTIVVRGHIHLTGETAFIAAGGTLIIDSNFDVPTLLQELPQSLIATTIATVVSQTEITLTEGAPDDDAYKHNTTIFHDITNQLKVSSAAITSYVAATKTIHLLEAPKYTLTVGDEVHILSDKSNMVDEIVEHGGYEGGMVYLDASRGSAGTKSFINGTLYNPTTTWAAAQTIATAMSLREFNVNEPIILDQAFESKAARGIIFGVDMNGQSVDLSLFDKAIISGTYTGTPKFMGCQISDTTGPGMWAVNSTIGGTITLTTADALVNFDGCYSAAQTGEVYPILDFSNIVGVLVVVMEGYSGDIEIKNMSNSANRLLLTGKGALRIHASCTAGEISISGHFGLVGSDGYLAAGGKISMAGNYNTSFLVDALPGVMLDTNVIGVTSQTELIIDDASPDDDAYELCNIIFKRDGTTKVSSNVITDYVASTGAITLSEAPNFTIQVGDSCSIISDRSVANNERVDGGGIYAIAAQLYVTGGTTPIPNAVMAIYDSSNQTFLSSITLDTNGQGVINLNPGAYKVRFWSAGYGIATQDLTVTTSEGKTFYGDSYVIPAPVNPDGTLLVCDLISLGLLPKEGVVFTAVVANPPVKVGGVVVDSDPMDATTNASGRAQFELVKGVIYDVTSDAIRASIEVDTTGKTSITLASYIGV